MAPRRLSSKKPVAPFILEQIEKVLLEEYEGRFRRAYEDTLQVLKIGGVRAPPPAQGEGIRQPLFPGEETRNALDHLGLSARWAYTADGKRFSVPLQPLKSNRGATPREESLTNLWQARRHLVIGRYHCFEHQIKAFLDLIEGRGKELTGTKHKAARPIFMKAKILNGKFRRTKKLKIKAIFQPAAIQRNVQALEIKIARLAEISAELGLLWKKMPKPRKSR